MVDIMRSLTPPLGSKETIEEMLRPQQPESKQTQGADEAFVGLLGKDYLWWIRFFCWGWESGYFTSSIVAGIRIYH